MNFSLIRQFLSGTVARPFWPRSCRDPHHMFIVTLIHPIHLFLRAVLTLCFVYRTCTVYAFRSHPADLFFRPPSAHVLARLLSAFPCSGTSASARKFGTSPETRSAVLARRSTCVFAVSPARLGAPSTLCWCSSNFSPFISLC
ncbi:hypothetical protein EXIGLDRAFT_198609 [Exidia glandulosa HHB12029]|uniref:Transmembrane protein n=1 Tax=Exidia glandulosa HHB12029 TaxID=1314781 RepID=A0A165MXH7_EXIGL|nr:hypothetical protein EXIGLDRAFT_198609 [Exidia glandulosa HHB12029]